MASLILLSSEQVQALVRTKRFDFEAAADHCNAISDSNSITAEDVRACFAKKKSLRVENGRGEHKKTTDMKAHKQRCDAAFLRAASAMSGGVDGSVEFNCTVTTEDDASKEGDGVIDFGQTNARKEEDILLAEQRDRLKKRFEPDSVDDVGELHRESFQDNDSLPPSPDERRRLPCQVVLIDSTNAAEIDNALSSLPFEDGHDGGNDMESWVSKHAV